MKKIILIISFAALMATVISPVSAVAAEPKVYKFVVPVLDEFGFSMFPALIQGVSDVVEKKTGIRIVTEQLDYTYIDDPVSKILDRMNAGEIDSALVFPWDYNNYLLHNRSNATPMFGMEVFGNNRYDICLFTRKEDKITKIEQLKGKTWGGVHTHHARFLLYKAGIDATTEKFFGKRKFVSEAQIRKILDKLLNKEIDVFTISSTMADLYFKSNRKELEKININSCEIFMNNYFIVYNENMPREDVRKLKKVFLNMHNDPEFASYRNLMTVTDGKFVDLDLIDIYDSMKLSFVADEQGWMEEEREYIKKNYVKMK